MYGAVGDYYIFEEDKLNFQIEKQVFISILMQ
jgi:hypothetical protein